MIREIVKDLETLKQVSHDIYVGVIQKSIVKDLIDTAKANRPQCIGLSSIQIGFPYNVIAVRKDKTFVVMVNPRIIAKSGGTYEATESCLSVDYRSKVKRYNTIKVMYLKPNDTRPTLETFSGLTAQIIQHECDHLKGKLI